MVKIRLDELLVERDMVADLKEAGARILAGEVIVDEKRIDKADIKLSRTHEYAFALGKDVFMFLGAAKN